MRFAGLGRSAALAGLRGVGVDDLLEQFLIELSRAALPADDPIAADDDAVRDGSDVDRPVHGVVRIERDSVVEALGLVIDLAQAFLELGLFLAADADEGGAVAELV